MALQKTPHFHGKCTPSRPKKLDEPGENEGSSLPQVVASQADAADIVNYREASESPSPATNVARRQSPTKTLPSPGASYLRPTLSSQIKKEISLGHLSERRQKALVE